MNVARAIVAEDVAEASLRDARLLAHQTLVQSIGQMKTAQEQVAIQTTSVAAATEDLRVQQRRYELGATTLLDLLTSQTQLDNARTALIRARYDYRVAKAQLEALIGRDLQEKTLYRKTILALAAFATLRVLEEEGSRTHDSRRGGDTTDDRRRCRSNRRRRADQRHRGEVEVVRPDRRDASRDGHLRESPAIFSFSSTLAIRGTRTRRRKRISTRRTSSFAFRRPRAIAPFSSSRSASSLQPRTKRLKSITRTRRRRCCAIARHWIFERRASRMRPFALQLAEP